MWQDFRVDEGILPWDTLLRVFEGTEVTIRRPRTDHPGDLDYKVCQPIFLTSSGQLTHHIKGEQDQMDRRLRYFYFQKSLPAKMVRKLELCAACFGSLLLYLTRPARDGPCLALGHVFGSEKAHCLSQEGSSTEPEFCRSDSACSGSSSSSSSSSSSEMPFCINCGHALTSSPYCGRTGKPHL